MTIERHIGDVIPTPAEVRSVLENVLASETLRGSPQLAAFLRFVVEAVLRGDSNRIKGYTIGVEALGRPENFDPQIDPIVRVEATRLRRALERYYAGPGANDPIVFELSRGSYVPNIRARAQAVAPTATPASGAGSRILRALDWRIALTLAAVLVVVAGAVAVDRYREKPGRIIAASGREGDQAFDGPLQRGNGMPTIQIARVSLQGTPPAPGMPRPQPTFANAFTEKLRAAIARFDTLNVTSDPADAGEPGPALAAAKSGAIANYQLLGSGEFREDGTINLRFRVLDTSDASVVWSRTTGPLGPTTDLGPLGDTIVRQLAVTLAQPFGVIRAHERVKFLAGTMPDPRYGCILEASESLRSFDPAQHARARNCLEKLTVRDPGFAMGFAYLAAVCAREFHYGLGNAPADPQLLDLALRAARHAVELSPESARAYQMLFAVLFARQQIPAAFAAGDKALALNPYDMTILSDYGGRLILSGEIDRGMEALSRAAEEGAVRPSWYQFYLFLGAYLKNDMVAASNHASQITAQTYPLRLLAHALVAAADGNRELAHRSYEQLVALQPGWRKAPRDELARLFPTPAVVDRIARDLANAGLAVAR